MRATDALTVATDMILSPTQYCVDDMLRHGIGNWHILVLTDRLEYAGDLSPDGLNDKDFSGNTPLDIAYQLNRTRVIESLESLGALGDKAFLRSRGVGQKTNNDKYIHLPGRQGKIRTLERRYMEGGCLNSRDGHGNTPIHLIAEGGHLKAAKFFSENHFRFNIDLGAKNNEGNTARNLAILAGHQDVADQLLIWEVESYITGARVRHKVLAGLPEMLPLRKSSRE